MVVGGRQGIVDNLARAALGCALEQMPIGSSVSAVAAAQHLHASMIYKHCGNQKVHEK